MLGYCSIHSGLWSDKGGSGLLRQWSGETERIMTSTKLKGIQLVTQNQWPVEFRSGQCIEGGLGKLTDWEASSVRTSFTAQTSWPHGRTG